MSEYTSKTYYLSSDAGEDEVSAHGVVVGEGHGGVLPAGAHPVYVADLKVELTGENVSNSDKTVQIQIQGKSNTDNTCMIASNLVLPLH